jgi:hypothetical protein
MRWLELKYYRKTYTSNPYDQYFYDLNDLEINDGVHGLYGIRKLPMSANIDLCVNKKMIMRGVRVDNKVAKFTEESLPIIMRKSSWELVVSTTETPTVIEVGIVALSVIRDPPFMIPIKILIQPWKAGEVREEYNNCVIYEANGNLFLKYIS